MKHINKGLISVLLLAAMVLSSVGVVLAAPGDGPRRGPGGPGGPPPGVGGEVTAMGESSLTVLTRDEQSVVVDVTSETVIRLAETRSEGSLSDIVVGDHVGVKGTENEDGTITAEHIIVNPPRRGERPDGPRRAPHAGGQVVSVDGTTINVENPRGTDTIITTADTEFLLAGEPASLNDVAVDKFVHADGERQEDGSFVATTVNIHDNPPPRPGPRPQRQ